MALTKIDDRGLKTPIDLLDNEKIRFGTGNDLEIYHQADSYSYIQDSFGNLRIDSDIIELRSKTGYEKYFKGTVNGAVELYYDNSKKLETTSSGTSVTGSISVDAGSNTTQAIFSGSGGSGARGLAILTESTGSADEGVIFNARASGTTATMKFQTNSSTALTIQGEGDEIDIPDDTKLRFGDGNDLQIYHTGSYAILDNDTGDTYIKAAGMISLNPANTEDGALIKANGAVELMYDNVKKFETTSGGASVTGDLNVTDGSAVITVKSTAAQTAGQLRLNGDAVTSADYWLGNIAGQWNGDDVATIRFESGDDTTNKDDGRITFNVSASGNSPSEAMRIEPNGKVGIGCTPSKLLDVEAAAGGNYVAHFRNGTSATPYTVQIEEPNSPGAGYPLLNVCSNGGTTEYFRVDSGRGVTKLKMHAGAGIEFSAYGGSDVNLLDDYEEGTWTPKLRLSDNLSADDPVSFTSRSGSYTKIGRLVHVRAFFNISNLNSETGNVYITLPFANDGNHFIGLVGDGFAFSTGTEFAGAFALTSGGLGTLGWQRESVWSHVTNSHLESGGMYMSGTYEVS